MKALARDNGDDLSPDDDESYDDFMDRCSDAIGDDDACQVLWDNRAAGNIKHKTHASTESGGLEFVLSDETPDRMGDVIMSGGWELDNFKKNPIALFGHRSDFPIGKWRDLRVENNSLRGHLELAPPGTSDRIDEIRKLVEADILRAVSVGFKPIETKPRLKTKDDSGLFFVRNELVETSLVSVPANPNALAVAKSLQISPATLDFVFAGHGRKNELQRRAGSPAGKPIVRRMENERARPMSLAQQITQREKRLLDRKDKLSAELNGYGEGGIPEEKIDAITAQNAEIDVEERSLAALRESERHLGATSDDGPATRALVPATPKAATIVDRPFAMPKKKLDPMDLFIHMGVVQLFARESRKPLDVVMRDLYGEDELHKAALQWTQRASTVPATTTLTGWAAELSQQTYTAFMESLYPLAIFPRLSAMGLTLAFGPYGKIIIPTRATTPTIAGSFVGEGLPIPVRQGLFTSQTLTPKKMAVITVWTRELSEHSVPAIEGLLRSAVQEDTAIALDAVLLDANASTVVRPAGILNGLTGQTPTAGGGFTALTGDIKNLTGALLTGTKGNVRSPAFLMNPQQVNSIGLTAAPGAGVFPFRDEIGQKRLSGWPVIDSGTVPLGTVIVIDAADFVSVGGEAPRFEISDQTTLHMDDTTPLDIGTAGTPPVVAAPVKSMFQTDSLALRLILPTNWVIRRAGVVAYVSGVTW